MDDFPAFMKNPANSIHAAQQSPGAQGYVYDGADGSQMAFFSCPNPVISTAHSHDFDEYFVVIQGCYTLILKDQKIPLKAGDEYLIPKGVWHGGEAVAGTRTIHAFGGKRADRR